MGFQRIRRADLLIGKANQVDMGTVGELISQCANEARAQVLIEQKLQDTAGSALRRRSRSAAKLRTAWMCSRRNSGKSASIACSSMPLARYSSTSETVMRVPLTQGLPLRTPGVI